MFLDPSIVKDILSRTDIGSFVGGYVALRKRGNDLVGLCPFHAENTPSFHVHPDRGFFKCFGCGVGGDAISFVQRLENLSFPEAARLLARRAGVELAEEDPGAARVRGERERIYAANEVAAAYFHRILKIEPAGEIARAYVKARGFTVATIDAFKLGFAPASWDGLVAELERCGIDMDLAERAYLVKAGQRGPYDFYRGRLMIPTYATTGEIVAFGGRSLDGQDPKYLNSGTTPVYTKGRGLYALNIARRAAAARGSLIVVEGYLDCIALHQAGFENTVASLGTAFTVEQAAELRKYAERVYLAFDADAAGSAATAKSIDILAAAGGVPYVVHLPSGEDPDSFVRSHGATAFATLVETALPWIQFKLDREIARIVADRLPPGRAAANAESLISALPRAEWDRWRVYVAQALGLSADDLRRSRFISNPATFAPRATAGFTHARATRHVAPVAEPPSIERDTLAALIDEPTLIAEYADQIPPTTFADSTYRAIYESLCARASDLATAADVLALLATDRTAIDAIVALQKPDRSSAVLFADSTARRSHLDRVVERLRERERERRFRELDARIDASFISGIGISDAEREEHRRLASEREAANRRRLGTK